MTHRPAHVLLLCGSRKPTADRPEVKSASRELLRFAAAGVRASGAPSTSLDLRDLELPWWDGRTVAECESPDLTRLDAAVRSSNVLLASVPAYWGGMSGVFKNVVDLLGGEAFAGLHVVPLVVGQDDASAWLAAGQLRSVCARLAAEVSTTELVVGNPREVADAAGLIRDAKRLGVFAGLLAQGRLETGPAPAAAAVPVPS